MKNRLQTAKLAAQQFIQWWAFELKACASDLVASLAPTWRRPLTLFVGRRPLILMDGESGDRTTLLEHTRADGQEPLPAQLPETVAQRLERGRRVKVLIATDLAFIQSIPMPIGAIPHLKFALSLQFPKLLPMSPADLITDFEVSRSPADNARVRVDLAALKRQELEVIVQGISAWGLRLLSVHVADGPDTPSRFRFWVNGETERPALSRPDRWLMGSAAVLGFACVATAATQTVRAQHALEVARSKTAVTASEALNRRQALVSKLDPLIELTHLEGMPTAASILREITALVPTGSWLTTFELKDHQLRLVGLSPNSAAVVNVLARSPLLNDVELRSSMSTGIGTGKDRFEVVAKIKSESL